jgi:H+/Cl- antiporter ClcA
MPDETTDGGPERATPAADPAALDPAAILRSRDFVKVLVLAAVVGVVVSVVGWGFLELVHQIQLGVFSDLPDALGFSGVPEWWYVAWLLIAGVVTAFAIVKLPGSGGHVPAHGLQVGGNEPNMVPGIALAAFASLGLGAVVGPEAPLIAIGAGVAVAFVKTLRRDSPAQLLMIVGAAGSFAAISVIFGSPIVAAILVVEATGLGGPMLPLVLIPGLMAAGIGSLVFIGMANFTGLDTSAYSLVPLHLPHFSGVTWEEIGWTVALGLAGAVITQVVRRIGLKGAAAALPRPWILVPAAGIVTALLAILFQQTTDHGASQVLFSGQEALPGLVNGAAGWSVGALVMVMVCKGLAWGACLGTFRGGPTFPAIYLGAAGGILASHLPGLPMAPAVAVGMGIMVVAFLKLPLSAVVIATALTISAGLALGPLIIVGVILAYLATLGLEGRLGRGGAPAAPAAT